MKDPHAQLLSGPREFELRRRRLDGGRVVYPRQEAISTRRNRLDVMWALGIVAQRFAQLSDVSSKQLITYAGAGPEAVKQFPFGHQPLSILHQVEQNLKCLRSEVHQVGIAPKLFVRGVQPKGWEYKNSPRCHCVPNGLRWPVLILTEVPRNLH